MRLRVLGVDPGTLRMGLGIVDAEGSDLSLAHLVTLSPDKKDSLPERLHYLYTRLLDLVEKWEPSVVAIEQPFVARNVRSAMAVGQAEAVAMMAAAHHHLPVSRYSPREVKRAVTDYGASSKEQVQEMVKVLLGLEQPPHSSDSADALAVAICHINASRVDDLTLEE